MTSKKANGRNNRQSRQKKSAPPRSASYRSDSRVNRNPVTGSSTFETKPTTTTRNVTCDAIAEAAYFLWLRRGGDELSNWIEAERLLRSQPAKV